MLETLRKLNKGIERLLEWVVTVIMLILVLDVTWQVVSRYVTRSPSQWSEELALVLLLWISLLGGTVAFVRRGHLGVDYFVEKLKGRARVRVEIFIYLWILLFAAALAYGGSALVMITQRYGQTLPALGWQRAWVYMALPVAGVLISLHAIEALWQRAIECRTSNPDRKAI